MCRRWRNTTLKPGSRRPHLWARWATSCARGWKRPIMSTRGPASSRFSLTMNESSFDRRPAHATDRSGPAVFDAMVPSIYPVCLRPRCNAAMRFSTDSDDPGPRYPDQRHRRLLRARRERPRRSAAEEQYELAPLHSITSSARASRVGGNSRPSAFAVLRLITNSYFVGACTGRSAGFLALQDAVDVAGSAPILVDHFRPVSDQAALGGHIAEGIDRGQLVPSCQRDDQLAMNRLRRASGYDQPAIRLACECRDGPFDLATITHVDRAQLHPKGWRHGLDCGELADPGCGGGVAKDRHSRHTGRDLLEQFQPFPADAVLVNQEACGIGARACQALDEGGADRVNGKDEHDRYGAGCLSQRCYCVTGRGQDDIRRCRHHLGYVSAKEIGIGRSPAGVDLHVTPDGPAQFLQPLRERRHPGCRFGIVCGQIHEYADAPHPLALLRTRRKRPRSRRAAEQDDEIAPSYT